VRAHAEDLRVEIRRESGDPAVADAVARDWTTAPLAPADRALCAWAWKLALRPGAMTGDDAAMLRAAGFDDRDVHDAAQVVSYFSYINRIADGLGVEPEPEWGEDPYRGLSTPVEDRNQQ